MQQLEEKNRNVKDCTWLALQRIPKFTKNAAGGGCRIIRTAQPCLVGAPKLQALEGHTGGIPTASHPLHRTLLCKRRVCLPAIAAVAVSPQPQVGDNYFWLYRNWSSWKRSNWVARWWCQVGELLPWWSLAQCRHRLLSPQTGSNSRTTKALWH